MANYTDDRLADWNSRPAFPSTREAKGQQMTPKRPRDPNQLAPARWRLMGAGHERGRQLRRGPEGRRIRTPDTDRNSAPLGPIGRCSTDDNRQIARHIDL
jgi:hypothetical protein